MIVLMLPFAIAAASFQSAAADTSRKAFVTCLHDAVETAKGQKVVADGFRDFAFSQCGDAAGKFKSAMVSFDMRNAFSRKEAESDAAQMVDDYMATAADRYKGMSQ